MIEVEFYAVLKDYFGSRKSLNTCKSINHLIDLLGTEKPASKLILENVKVAVNNQFVSTSTVLEDGDVISLLPPSSGG